MAEYPVSVADSIEMGYRIGSRKECTLPDKSPRRIRAITQEILRKICQCE